MRAERPAVAHPGWARCQNPVKTYRQVRDKLDVNFQDFGEQELKNISRPVRVYQLRPDTPAPAGGTSTSGLALPDKPSIAFLPFQNMSGDREHSRIDCDLLPRTRDPIGMAPD